jgi:hypothetical protein
VQDLPHLGEHVGLFQLPLQWMGQGLPSTLVPGVLAPLSEGHALPPLAFFVVIV